MRAATPRQRSFDRSAQIDPTGPKVPTNPTGIVSDRLLYGWGSSELGEYLDSSLPGTRPTSATYHTPGSI